MLGVAWGPLHAQTPAPAAMPRPRAASAAGPLTRPELTEYRETSRYDDVMGFVRAVTRGNPRMHLTRFGYSYEGRELPLVVVGDVADPSPEAVLASGRLRVFVQANIHAGEVEGKEAVQELLRDLAQGRNARWLDSLVLLIAPIYNADGNERVARTNRPLQNGPIGGMGQRANAQGLDLNRDHMKLEAAEARALVLLMNRYDPQVLMDLHTTDGSVHGYHLTYSTPLNPGTDSAIVSLLRDAWLPEATRRVKARDGWDIWYYGNLPGGPGLGEGETERGWYTFDYRPRFNNNYIGLRNRFAILSEAYSYASFEERIRVTLHFVEECVDFAYRHASEVRRIVAAADVHSAVGEALPVRSRFRRGGQVPILLGDVVEERHPYTGQRVLRRVDARRAETMTDYAWFEPDETERAPRAYFVPASFTTVIERLEAHGVRTSRLDRPLTLQVERFRVDSTWTAERPFQNHRERTVRGAYEQVQQELRAATVVVRVDQPLGRLAFFLLEPRSDDGLLNWNFFDDALQRDGRYCPVLRTTAAF